MGEKTLIAYFSHTERDATGMEIDSDARGHAATVAGLVREAIGADVFEIRRKDDYPQDHRELIEAAKQEKADGARPELDGLPDMSGYGTLVLGYPNWCGDLPMPVYTFLEDADLSGVKILPYCTNGGGGMNSTVETIAELCPGSEVAEGLSVKDKEIDDAGAMVKGWLAENL